MGHRQDCGDSTCQPQAGHVQCQPGQHYKQHESEIHRENQRERENRYCGYIPLYDIPTKSKKHSYAFNIAAALV